MQVNMKKIKFIFSLLIVVILFSSCQQDFVAPKPIGYFRILIPDTAYTYTSLSNFPYAFRLSNNAYIEEHFHDGDNYWIDIQYPMLNATIHCSYKPIENNFNTLSRDAQEFLYKHATIASAIPVQEYANPSARVWGLYCELHGNTATPIQFVLTDSTDHFFRASVYCNCIPNQDSLAPVYDYLRKDARVIMESMEWHED